MTRCGDRVWIDADLAPVAFDACRAKLLTITTAATGAGGAPQDDLERLRLLARPLGQLTDEPGGER